MPATTTIRADATTVKWGLFSADTPAVAEIESGDDVVIETLSGEPWDLPDDPRFTILPEHRSTLEKAERGPGPHPVTGPVAVKGARPGTVLSVEVLEITPRQDWGWALVHPLLGTLPGEFDAAVRTHFRIDMARGVVELPFARDLALKPFFGVMGVAPPAAWGRVTTLTPWAHGGNLDNKELGVGTTIHFPVFNAGGLFSVGDGHGAQGDGEVSVTAVETALTGRFRLTVREETLTRPRAETATQYITMGFDADLDNAVKDAVRDMVDWLEERHGLSRVDAYMLCSFAGDARVTQVVNPNKGAHFVFPKAALR